MKKTVLEYLYLAIENIPEHYFTLSNPQGYSKLKRHPERLFTYELYHQLRSIIEKEQRINNSKENDCENFFIDAEIYKKIERTTFLKKDVTEKGYKETKSVLDRDKIYPDLVIHNTQMSREKEDQFLIMECKTQSENLIQDSFNHDFFKLNEYISLLNFQFSVYLIINKNEKDVKEFITQYKKKYWTSEFGNVIFFVKENYTKKTILFNSNLEDINANIGNLS